MVVSALAGFVRGLSRKLCSPCALVVGWVCAMSLTGCALRQPPITQLCFIVQYALNRMYCRYKDFSCWLLHCYQQQQHTVRHSSISHEPLCVATIAHLSKVSCSTGTHYISRRTTMRCDY